jgi:hypothetical protein
LGEIIEQPVSDKRTIEAIKVFISLNSFMLEGIMITIGFTDETTTPPTQWVKTLPEDTKLEMILGLGKEKPFFKEIKIDGESFSVEGISNSSTAILIIARHLTGAKRVTEG